MSPSISAKLVVPERKSSFIWRLRECSLEVDSNIQQGDIGIIDIRMKGLDGFGSGWVWVV
jgi:hypothetical protein